MKILQLHLHGLSFNVWEVGKEKNIDRVRSESPQGTVTVVCWLTITLGFLKCRSQCSNFRPAKSESLGGGHELCISTALLVTPIWKPHGSTGTSIRPGQDFILSKTEGKDKGSAHGQLQQLER